MTGYGYCDICQQMTEVRMLDIDHNICEECCGAGWDNLTRLYYVSDPYKDWPSLRNEIIFYSVILVILGVLWFYFG